jgi:cellulose synthase operon protein C
MSSAQPRSPATRAARAARDGGARLPFAGALLGALVAAAGASSGGCARAARPAIGPAEASGPASAEVSDDGFAAAVRDVLLSARGSADRAVRLGAVEARQMARAEERFKARDTARGVAAVTGALYLVHSGEATEKMLGPDGVDALRAAVHELALRGDEGRSRALYDLLDQVAPAAERPDIEGHLRSLDAWMRDAMATGGDVANAGAYERAAVRRRLLEPSDAARIDADKTLADWIGRAVSLRDAFRRTRRAPAREEASETWRALETGPLVAVALYLRDGDASGALAALDRMQARDLLASERRELAAALEAQAQEPSPGHCIELLDQLKPLTSREPTRDDEDFTEDRDIFGAAGFGVAADCYRLDPTVPLVALTLAVALGELGMAEAAPAVLVDAVRAHPDPRVIGESLAVTLEALATEEDAEDPAGARRTYAAAAPLLAAASQKDVAGRVRPSAARVRAAMGEIELRAGHAPEAHVLLEQSAAEEKSAAVLLSLARLDWRDGQTKQAVDRLRDALGASDAERDPALRGEVLLTLSDVTRDSGDPAGARTPLAQALTELVQSRPAQEGDARARVERVLAQVLDRFGAAQPAQQALERAYAAARGDKHQATQTIELLIGRAFVRGDLSAAREGLAWALSADLDGDDLVYFALWVRLLERELRVPTDGEADKVFASIPDDGRWVAVLARFGEGKVKGDEIVGRATTPIQKYEALFYDGMEHRVAGDTKRGDEMLREVIAGTGMDLSEVTLARDILDPGRTTGGGPLPADVVLP